MCFEKISLCLFLLVSKAKILHMCPDGPEIQEEPGVSTSALPH
jgi:hypothetical protein